MHAPAGLSPHETAALTRRITLMSVATAGTLVVLKVVAWIASGSVALLASAADSGLDLVASLVTFFAVRYAAEPPDAEHRFGHGKAEAIAAMFQVVLISISALAIAARAVEPVRHAAQPLSASSKTATAMLASAALRRRLC